MLKLNSDDVKFEIISPISATQIHKLRELNGQNIMDLIYLT